MTRDREDDLPVEGLRERKRRETAERIRETGIRLFMEKGYAATTLEDIAGEAGISRRTFFYYYKSKDDILLTMQNGTGAAVAAALREAPPDKRPFEAVRDAVLRLTASIPHDELIVLDRLMRSSEAVQARKAASYIQHEQTVFAALRKKWPEPEREAALRWIAMLAIGGLRLSLEAFSREEGKRPLVDFVREAFDTLEHEVGHHGS